MFFENALDESGIFVVNTFAADRKYKIFRFLHWCIKSSIKCAISILFLLSLGNNSKIFM